MKTILKGILTNPLILGCAAGVTLNLLGLRLPGPIETGAGNVAKAAPVLSLFLMGCYFEISSIGRNLRTLAKILLVRLVLIPLIAVLIAAAMGFRKVDMLLILVNFAAPTGVLVFSFANKMDGDLPLATSAIMASTLFSSGSLCIWLTILMSLQMI